MVGRRVVVRRILRGVTGPTGGPAFTDLLGVCLAWADGRCVLQPEAGEPVEIALADIVSGKPVPPRPSVRQRVSAEEAEARAAAAGLACTPGSELWLASVARVRRQLPRPTTQAELAVSGTRATSSVEGACDVLAEGRAAIDGVWVGLHGVLVDPAHRRRGLATAVVAELLACAAEQGAMTAALDVAAADADRAAGEQAFWAALGFAPHHTCGAAP